MGYGDLYEHVKKHLDITHVEGQLKAEVIADPARYVMADPETPLALLDQKHAGKRLLLITNSEWHYTNAMMAHTFDPYLNGMTWRQLFDVVIVGARKPDFFTSSTPFFEVATPDGLLRPAAAKLQPGGAYFGGSAARLERDLGVSGDEILYVGDHMFGDVLFTKRVLRWRTALILRELEGEIEAIQSFAASEANLAAKMHLKEEMEVALDQAKLAVQRKKLGYGPQPDGELADLERACVELRAKLVALDGEIAPLARAAVELSNPWGLLTRAGNDKSHLARQIERYADIYTSRVSNFLQCTPFHYLRSRRGSLPHDPVEPGGEPTVPV
jgi:hypothetical protein